MASCARPCSRPHPSPSSRENAARPLTAAVPAPLRPAPPKIPPLDIGALIWEVGARLNRAPERLCHLGKVTMGPLDRRRMRTPITLLFHDGLRPAPCPHPGPRVTRVTSAALPWGA